MTFTATNEVPCGECGGDTIPPYTSESGVHFPGHYCEGCGWTTHPKPGRVTGCIDPDVNAAYVDGCDCVPCTMGREEEAR